MGGVGGGGGVQRLLGEPRETGPRTSPEAKKIHK